MPEPNRAGPPRGELWRDATLTLAAVLLAFAACDDLTTGNATTFTVEWSALALCPSWLLFVSWRLLRGERRWLGLVSVIVVAAGVAAVVGAGFTVRRGTGPVAIEFLITVAGLLWFLGVAGILAGRGWRAPSP